MVHWFTFLIHQYVTLHFDMVQYVTDNFNMLQSSLIWYRTVHFGALCYGTRGGSVSSGVLHIVMVLMESYRLASHGFGIEWMVCGCCAGWCGYESQSVRWVCAPYGALVCFPIEYPRVRCVAHMVHLSACSFGTLRGIETPGSQPRSTGRQLATLEPMRINQI